METNKLEKFEIVKINRKEIHGADYNPRKITEQNKKRLKSFIQKSGILAPSIIVNKRNYTLVSGHKRLEIMDSILRKDDYELTISMVDLTEKEEIEANIKLNNSNLQGEWDKDKFWDIKDLWPEIDFKADLDFDQLDLDMLFSDTPDFIEKLTPKQEAVKLDIAQIEALKETKKKHRDQVKAQNENGESYQIEKDDYMLTFVFNNNAEKASFLEKIIQKKSEKYLKSSVLFDILKDEFKYF